MKQFLLFIVSGGLAAFLNWSSRFLFSIWMPFEIAVICSFFVGLISGYILMRAYVFKRKEQPLTPQVIKYIGVNAIALMQTLAISVILVRWIFPAWGMSANTEALAHLTGILVPVITSYFGHKFVTFR